MKHFVGILISGCGRLAHRKPVAFVVLTVSAVAIGIGGVAIASATGTAAAQTSSSEVSALSDAELAKVALNEAQAAGDEAPSELQTVKTDVLEGTMTISPTSKAPAESPEVRQWLDQKAELEVLHGHFTLMNADLPSGASAPTGSVLSLVVSTETGAIEFRALTNSGPSQQALEALGQVSTNTDPASSDQ